MHNVGAILWKDVDLRAYFSADRGSKPPKAGMAQASVWGAFHEFNFRCLLRIEPLHLRFLLTFGANKW